MSDKVKVLIQCQQVVKYDQEIEMAKDKFDDLDKRLSSNDRRERERAEEEVFDYLNLREASDWGDNEIDTFEIVTE